MVLGGLHFEDCMLRRLLTDEDGEVVRWHWDGVFF